MEVSAFEEALQEKVANKRIEMIWFGGISNDLSKDVFHVTLQLEFKDSSSDQAAPPSANDQLEIKKGRLTVKKLRNRQRKFAQLKIRDRFFYNQEFYLQEPTEQLTAMGLGYTGRYTSRFFNRNRFIGVVGREAFHVFDLAQMDFIYADEASGYKVNIDKSKYDLY